MESVGTWLYDLMGSLSNMTLGFGRKADADVSTDDDENDFEILDADELENQSSLSEGLVSSIQLTEELLPSAHESCGDQDGGGNVQVTSNPTPQELEERGKRMQQLLVLLLNAQKCEHRENQPNGEVQQCSQPHCATTKDILSHMTTCQAGKSCQFPHCRACTHVLSHWKNCGRADCPICLPVKQASEKRAGQSAVDQAKEIRKKMVCERRPFNVGYYGNINGPQRWGKPPPSSINVPVVSKQVDMAVVSEQVDMAAVSEQAMEVDWHQFVTPDLRKHFVNKLVQAMLTTFGPSKSSVPQMLTLFASVQKVESELYEMATSQYEYSILLAEKVEKIQEQWMSTQIG